MSGSQELLRVEEKRYFSRTLGPDQSLLAGYGEESGLCAVGNRDSSTVWGRGGGMVKMVL